MGRAFRRVDLPGGGGEEGSHCQGVRNISPNLKSGRSGEHSTQNYFNLAPPQALVKLRPESAGEGGTIVKGLPCVERGLDNFRSIRSMGEGVSYEFLSSMLS